ncbi:hypothetical protein EV363DRAFT_677949 [Boletus edulis]|uniref:Uncharacterized protein n=1 Tax=Boletus edulis BED1 TaxID=1328754 RepID=A0AAD4G8I0_BOLED|nr:hypothetical protein EV363DRAFT_677949 [Boletus edulis]KAF8428431.1 hypothetical protein L210DRAFT_984558 [Boletus edulis BED1]
MNHINPSNVILHNNGAGSNQFYVHTLNPPIHPGGMHAAMPQYYTLQDQRVIERVPRPPQLSPPSESVPAITFSVNGYPGVRMKDIQKDRVTVDAPNDLVFEEYGFRSIVINLEWPGYESRSYNNPMHSRIDVSLDGRCMPRQHLAKEICRLLLNLHRYISKYPITPGWEKWALTAGSEGIRVPDIVLFSLHYYRNVWVPELYVIE